MGDISPAHPRAESLRARAKLAQGFKAGLVAPEGLAAHGRGEAFDYFLGERTTLQAKKAIEAAAAALVTAENPAISVNGNAAALVPEELVQLSRAARGKLEVNLFHGSQRREAAIAARLRKCGAEAVYGVDPKFSTKIREIQSNRRKVDKRGIAAADVVLIPLEDGDRAEALRNLGKVVIAIDLNPMSRTARVASITIVDNIVRAAPLLVNEARRLSKTVSGRAKKIARSFDNGANLAASLDAMSKRLESLSDR